MRVPSEKPLLFSAMLGCALLSGEVQARAQWEPSEVVASTDAAATNAAQTIFSTFNSSIANEGISIGGSTSVQEVKKEFPDAPAPIGAANSMETARASAIQPSIRRAYVPLDECPYDETRARECRMHWGQMLIESMLFNAFEDAGNLYTGYWYRYETTHGKWWQRTIDSAAQWRWNVWNDDNPPLDDYVAHPMMGAITNSIWIQNDPKGMTLTLANHWPYWRSRLRATAWSTFYSFAWKLGPFGEAAIGHNGDH